MCQWLCDWRWLRSDADVRHFQYVVYISDVSGKKILSCSQVFFFVARNLQTLRAQFCVARSMSWPDCLPSSIFLLLWSCLRTVAPVAARDPPQPGTVEELVVASLERHTSEDHF